MGSMAMQEIIRGWSRRGWVLLAGHTAIMLGGAWQFQHRPDVVLAWLLLTSVLPLPLYAAKTRGGWKWRGPGKS